ncbi:hypothetical protein PR202_gb12995 [Eleusine coracana subsp. coracana]|uniref:Uncharacterized protein n=1 Tax=Eleusine coracana subsp. coracana TaxID=191504 RepID=A0AAV5ERX3_ELECO|nr:hypothetical protein PR202_gb12995 [Eleusine coracana subsp. coracana]
MINGETKHCGSYENISFEQLGEIMLPNAVDCLRVRAADTSYQMLWKSKHGGAYFRVKKTSWRAANSKGRGEKLQKLRGKDVQGWTCEIAEFIDSWVAYAPAQLQGPISDWVWKEKQMPPIQEEMTPTE